MDRSVQPASIPDAARLANGVQMPRLGVGTYRASEGYEVEREVTTALEIGYRGVDTASMYGNEDGVGKAIRESGLPREDVFVATKVWNDEQGYRGTLEAVEASLDRLGMEYVDLYLVHWPIPSLMSDTWQAMEEILHERKARAIGVCNHLVHHLEALARTAEVRPMVDQVEHHPGLQQPDLREYCVDNNVQMEAWAPVMRGRVFQIPVLVEIGERHGKTAAQVSIRWILQHGVVTIPKSVHVERLRENADVFDFQLTEAEMAAIDALDRDERVGPHPDRYGW